MKLVEVDVKPMIQNYSIVVLDAILCEVFCRGNSYYTHNVPASANADRDRGRVQEIMMTGSKFVRDACK